MSFETDIKNCLEVLINGGLILYPTDTVWGIGCDATNESAINKIYHLKKRGAEKKMIILLADASKLIKYTEGVSEKNIATIKKFSVPTTVIYEKAIHLPFNLVHDDGSIAIRVVKDSFCKRLIEQFEKPVVATSANISGNETAQSFEDISQEIKNGVDYIVQHRQSEKISSPPSAIIKLNRDGSITKIR
jgi:Sua5/YciO/YrdC/YwlC family protein